MGLLSFVVASFVGAALYSAVTDKKPAQPTRVVYEPQHYTVNIAYNTAKNETENNVRDFLKSYNDLTNLCISVFGEDQYNPIKKLANAIKFNTSRDDYDAQKVVDHLYKVVDLRNNYLAHNSLGIGAIPCREYITFMDRMWLNLKANKQKYIYGYEKFLNYKQRQLTYRRYY